MELGSSSTGSVVRAIRYPVSRWLTRGSALSELVLLHSVQMPSLDRYLLCKSGEGQLTLNRLIELKLWLPVYQCRVQRQTTKLGHLGSCLVQLAGNQLLESGHGVWILQEAKIAITCIVLNIDAFFHSIERYFINSQYAGELRSGHSVGFAQLNDV